MRYLNTKNIIAAGVLLSCMNSIAWGAIIPDRTRIIMNESDKGEALKLTNQSKKLPYLAQTWIEELMKKLLNFLRTEKLCSILTCEKYRQKQIKKM